MYSIQNPKFLSYIYMRMERVRCYMENLRSLSEKVIFSNHKIVSSTSQVVIMSKRKSASESDTVISRIVKSSNGSGQPTTSEETKMFGDYEEFMAKINKTDITQNSSQGPKVGC